MSIDSKVKLGQNRLEASITNIKLFLNTNNCLLYITLGT